MKTKQIGNLLLLNLVLNTEGLKNMQSLQDEDKGAETAFAKVHPIDLYSRIVSDIDFEKLSPQDQCMFLFLKSDKGLEVSIPELYNYEMQSFMTEAHNRTCEDLGVPKTNFLFCEFSKNKFLNPEHWILYDGVSDNILFNVEKNYDLARPSLLLENINGATRHHSIYQNIFKALKDPDSVSDRDYFLSLTAALKSYVYQQLRENDPEAYQFHIKSDYSTPTNIEEIVYSFDKTRRDFEKGFLYGGTLRNRLRDNERSYHDYLQEELLTKSIVNLEDIFAYFKQSELNEVSGGMMYKILQTVARESAPIFYNSLGADMKPGQTISQYIDELEQEMFERAGVELPTDEQLEEFMESGEFDKEEFFEALRQYKEEMGDVNPEEGGFEGGTDFSQLKFKKMKSALPQENEIAIIKDLPFHNYQNPNPSENPNQGPAK